MKTFRSTVFRVAAVLAAFGVAAISMTAAVTQDGGGSDQMTIAAVFTDSSPMVAGNYVRASGVEVGQISSIELRQGRAYVEMTVDRSVLPLHRDATATITTQDLLGERFIALERGSPSAPLLTDPPVIPNSNTDRVVTVQEVLNTLDKPTATGLGALLTTLGEGMSGEGATVAAAAEAFEPAMRSTHKLAQVLNEHNALLSRLVSSTEPVAEALAAGRGRNLDKLVGSTERTLAAVAANREAVKASLRKLPATIAKARRTLAQVSGVADAATPTLAGMRPITDDLTDISAELQRFADAADPALASLTPVLERAERMVDELAPLVATLRPAGADLKSVADSYRTLAEEALSTHLTDFMEFVKGWALSTTDYDQLGHYFRASVPLTPKVLGSIVGGPIPGAPDPLLKDSPAPPVHPIPLPGKNQGPVSELVPGGRGESTTKLNADESATELKPGRSATGLTRQQENNMLGQLLGGL